MIAAEKTRQSEMAEAARFVWKETVLPGLFGGVLALAPIWMAMVLLMALLGD